MARRRIEPLLWLAFSGGGVTAAMLLPVLAVLFAFAFPLGWVDPPDHGHLAAVLGHPITFLALFGAFAVILVHSAHRLRHTIYDGLQVKHKLGVAMLCYGAAGLGTFVALDILASAT